MNKAEFLKKVCTENNLTKEDLYQLHGTWIILKTGIQKVVQAQKFNYDFQSEVITPDYCAIRCTVYKDGDPIAESYGSAEKANVKNSGKYYLEMAEKRAKARAVLMAIDSHGYIYSEDEADDFKQPKNKVDNLLGK